MSIEENKSDICDKRQRESICKVRNIIIVLIISLMFVLPVIIGVDPPHHFSADHPFEPRIHLMLFLLPLACLVLFMVNYFFVVPHIIDKLRGWNFIGINILMVIALTLVIQCLHFFVFKINPQGAPPERGPWLWSSEMVHFVFRDILYFILAIVLAYALRSYQMRIEASNLRLAADVSSRSLELKYLQMQLNPHFLFNTLNNIYALTAISPQRAQTAIMSLGKMLRYIIYESGGNFVPLSRELAVVDNFISLWKLRIEPAFSLRVEIASGVPESFRVPPLVILTLVENAFKHCDRTSQGAFISIAVATSPDGKIDVETSNSYSAEKIREKKRDAFAPSSSVAGSAAYASGGIGLINIRQQLALIYPDEKYRFDITDTGSVFTVSLHLDAGIRHN